MHLKISGKIHDRSMDAVVGSGGFITFLMGVMNVANPVAQCPGRIDAI